LQLLGQIESGIDFERRIAEIYDRCRTPAEIDAAFTQLRTELEADIQARMAKAVLPGRHHCRGAKHRA